MTEWRAPFFSTNLGTHPGRLARDGETQLKQSPENPERFNGHEPVILEEVLVEHSEIIRGTCCYLVHAIGFIALVFPTDYTSAVSEW